MTHAKVTAIGDEVAVILPPEIARRLKLVAGDVVRLTEGTDDVRITREDPEVARQMALGEQILKDYDAALHVLAR